MGWAQDYASTIVVEPYNEASQPVVSLFGGDGFGCDTATVLPAGSYNSDQLRKNNIDPTEIRGFRVPPGIVLEIYSEDYQSGPHSFVDGSDLANSQVDLYAHKTNGAPAAGVPGLGKFYRNVLSLKIGKVNEIYPITAHWERLDFSWGNPLKVTIT